jgi:broad specificity phosphatase PhoE
MGVSVEVVFETHATSEDNEAGIATGWLLGRLSAAGLGQARELGARRGSRSRSSPAAAGSKGRWRSRSSWQPGWEYVL